MRKTSVIILICLALLILQPAAVEAHQPRLVDGDMIVIDHPEVSKAYYDTLAGSPRTFVIESGKPFLLYLNLLVPESSNPQGRYSAIVYTLAGAEKTELARLDAASVVWKEFYEEYGGDYYLWGPEYERQVPAGRYEIVVYSTDNLGRYVLATGKEEDFPPIEIARTFLTLPFLKIQFFQYPLQTLLASPVILVWLVIVVVLAAGIVLILFRVFLRRPGRTS